MRVFVDVIKVRIVRYNHSGLGLLKPMMSLYKREERTMQRHREAAVWSWGQSWGTEPRQPGASVPPAAARSQDSSVEGFSRRVPTGDWACWHSVLDFWPPEPEESTISVVLRLQVCGNYHGSPRKQIDSRYPPVSPASGNHQFTLCLCKLSRWVKVAQSCPSLCDPMDCIVYGILPARILGWVAFPFSRGSSQPRDQTQVSHIAGGFFTSWGISEALLSL